MMSLTYSDGPDEALVTLVVKEFAANVPSFLGRTAVQKLCYFSRELGVPFSYRFSIYHYGPYSDDLASALDYMMAERVLIDQSPAPERYSDFRLGASANDLLQRHRDLVSNWGDTIRSVAQAFGHLRPETLELMATVHFVHRRLAATGIKPSQTQVISEFRSEKGEKFDSAEIEMAYNALKNAGILN